MVVNQSLNQSQVVPILLLLEFILAGVRAEEREGKNHPTDEEIERNVKRGEMTR